MSAPRRVFAALAALGLAAAPAPVGAAEVVLAFEGAPGGPSSGFRIERRAAGGKAFEPLALVGPGVVRFVDRSPEAGQLLCYRVRSLASRSPRDWSTEVCVAASDGPAAAPGPAAASATGEAGAAAGSPGPPAEPRRVRAGGGWLQVLE